jgi:hypothetical protein
VTQSADAYLHAIYDRYIGAHPKPIDPSEANIRKYFEADLAAKMIKDDEQAEKNGEVPALEGDAFVDAQDFDIKSFAIHVDHETPTNADATIKFTNAGDAKTIRVLLVKAGGGWKIHDIVWNGDEGTLRGLYK